MPEFVGRLRTPRLSAAPASPVVGEMYYDTGTNTLFWWNGTAWTTARGGIPPLVSALPGTPADGDVISYQNAAMAALGHVWQFRYRAAGGTYKWEFVGGSAWENEVDAAQAPAVGSAYVDFATVGPQVTVPLAGDYQFDYGCYVGPIPINSTGEMTIKIGAAAAALADAMNLQGGDATNAGGSVMMSRKKTISAAATLVKCVGRSVTTLTGIGSRWLKVTPIRVG